MSGNELRGLEPSREALFAPEVRFVSTGESQFDAMMTWRAELELAYLKDGDNPGVLAGYADFVTIRTGEHPIGDLLDSLSPEAEHFAGLFEGDDVNEALEEQFEDVLPFHRVLIVTKVFVAEPVRGNDLGAWLVAEVIARMAGAIDTLVLMDPFPAVDRTGGASKLTAVDTAVRYWRRVGLVPLDADRAFLGQSTGYVSLAAARQALGVVGEVEISVSESQIWGQEMPTVGRDTLITAG